MNTNFWWFKVDAKGVKEPAMVQLTKENLNLSIGEYIVNPDNRNVLELIPEAIKNIEKRTKNNIPGSNEVNMEYFRDNLKTAFNEVMSSEVRDLVNKHIDKNEPLFKELKISSETETLEDLTDTQSARDFAGSALSLDKDKSKAQKDLLNRKVDYTNDEFFKGVELNFNDITAKKSSITFKVDLISSDITEKKFKKVFPKSAVNIIEHPRMKTSRGGGPWVGTTPYSGRTETSSMHGIREQFDRGAGTTSFPNWAGLDVNKHTAKYLELLDNSWKAENKTDKARLADLRRFIGDKTFKNKDEQTKFIKGLISKLISLGNAQKDAPKAKAMSKFKIELKGPEGKLLKEALKQYENKKGGESLFKKFVQGIIDNGQLYKHLRKAHNVDFSINDLSEFDIKLTFNTDIKPNKYGDYALDSTIKETKSQTVDLSALVTAEGVTQSVKPYIAGDSRKQKERAFRTMIDKKGFNRARSYFTTQINSHIDELKEAAAKINVALEA
tara:strand:- start:756 stop:2249 length:1494 start_codon:yes stop_codon:yes gene_type:complete